MSTNVTKMRVKGVSYTLNGKLYDTTGLNTDGSMTQYAITSELEEAREYAESAYELAEQVREDGKTVIEGNVSNNPDEEDLTSVLNSQTGTNELKLKDRAYVPVETTKGYVILRKDKTLDEQMNPNNVPRENTIFEIRYNFNLNGSTLTIPNNCSLKFAGGKFTNGTIEGNHATIIDNPTYNIFDDCEVLNFNFGFIDVRWFGAVADAEYVDSHTCNGTDNAVYFEQAIDACHNNPGAYVKVVGKYRIASTIETMHDLNLFGEYHINRNMTSVSEFTPSNNFNSLIYVDKCTAFRLIGRGTTSKKIAFIDVSNIFFRAITPESGSNNTIVIESLASGAPTRTGKFKDCECRGFDIVIKIGENPNVTTTEGTTYGCFVVDGCVSYYGRQFLYCDAAVINGKRHKSIDNLVIRSCNLEQTSGTVIEIWDAVSGISITDNIIEGSPHAIDLRYCTTATIHIARNYFEAISNDDTNGNYVIYAQGMNMNTRLHIFQNTIMTNSNSNYNKDIIIKGPIVVDDVDTEFTIHVEGIVQFQTNSRRHIESILMENLNGAVISRDLIYHDLYDAYNKVDNVSLLTTNTSLTKFKNLFNDIFGFELTGTGNYGMFDIVKPDGSAFNTGDVVYVCLYFHQYTNPALVRLYNGNTQCATERGIYGTSKSMVICSFKLNANAQGLTTLKMHIQPSSTDTNKILSVGTGCYYVKDVNDETSKSLFGLGVVCNCIKNPVNVYPENIKGSFFNYVGNRKGKFFSDGEDIRNIDGSLVSKVKIVSKYASNMFDDTNVIYKIVGDINIGTDEVHIGSNCILDFSAGGSITSDNNESKAFLFLDFTRIFPECAVVRRFIKSNVVIRGYFVTHQCIYDNKKYIPLWFSYSNKVPVTEGSTQITPGYQYTDATGTPVGYTVSFHLTNVSCDNLIFYALVGESYTMTFTPSTGMTLSSFTIQINQKTPTATNYTYSVADNVGTLTLTPKVHGIIVINVKAQ